MAITGPIEQAVILAGGRGTRLGELTDATPKPLLPVGGTPFLTWLVGCLEVQAIDDVILTTGYRASAFEAWEADVGVRSSIRTFIEEDALGTGGALPLISEWLADAFFVLNGDTIFDVDLAALEARMAASGAKAAVALRAVPDVSRYGAVTLEEDDVVATWGEKSTAGPGLINGGVYAFRKETVVEMPSPGSLETDLIPLLIERRELVGLVSDGFFIDIGVPETFEEAQKAVPAWWWGRSR